jgi:hypothetical protein
MNRITLLGVMLLCFCTTVNSQSCPPESFQFDVDLSQIGIEGFSFSELNELLDRYHNSGPYPGSISDFFNLEEQAVLQTYFSWLKGDRKTYMRKSTMNEIAVFCTESTYEKFSKFDANAADDLIAITPLGSTSFENAGTLNTSGDAAYVLGSDGDFWTVNVATGAYTFLGTITPVTGGTWVGLELDQGSGVLYALSGNFTVDNHLYEIDESTLTATLLPNPTGMPGGGIAIAIDGAGAMWSYDITDNNLYAIDKNTGLATLVGPIGFDANFGQGMAYDATTDTVYMSAFNLTEYQAEWRSVDTTTGNTTLIDVIGTTNPGGIPQVGWVSMIMSPIPLDNDECQYARTIDCGESIAGDTSDGNTDTNGNTDPELLSPEEWFKYSSSTPNEVVVVSTCGQADFDTRITVWQDCSLVPIVSNDNANGCSGNTSELSFLADGSSDYFISVDGFDGASGSFELSVDCILPPPNDLIANAIDIDEAGVPYSQINVGTPAATLENGSPDGCDLSGVKGVWYKFTAGGTGTASVEIISPVGVSFAIFFKAPNENAIEDELEFFLQAGNQCSPATSANITTEAGQAYYVFVANEAGVTTVTLDGTLLGATDWEKESFFYYPNPVNDRLMVHSAEVVDEIELYNLLGERLMIIYMDRSSFEIDTSRLTSGSYLVKARLHDRMEVFRIIVR